MTADGQNTPGMRTRAKRLAETVVWVGRGASHRLWKAGEPTVFCNSVQKAGTHLLANAVGALPGLRSYGRKTYHHYLTKCYLKAHRNSSPERVIQDMRGFLPGEVTRGHVSFEAAIDAYIRENGVKHVLIVRDPRAVVVSHLFWWKRHTDIDTWPFRFFQALESDQERLRFLILGDEHPRVTEDERRTGPFPNLIERFRSYEGWLSSTSCLVVRFEELTSAAQRDTAFGRIHAHIYGEEKPFKGRAHRRMVAGSSPRKSRTYRMGDRRTWEDLIEPEQLQLLDDLGIGNCLAAWGYGSAP
jgi:hypothetical protein